MIARSARTIGSVLFRYRAHILVDIAVAALVLALPLSLQPAASTAKAHEQPQAVALNADVEAPRAATVSRGATIATATDPATSVTPDAPPIVQYTLGEADTLMSLANFFHVSAEAIAVSNGITEPSLENQQGRTIMIPPGQGALYTVQEGDTVASVAERFKVDPKVVMEYNRLYFEPEHFAPGQLIFVAGAEVPGLVWAAADDEAAEPPAVFARAAPAATTTGGRLAWPVPGFISQYFWGPHTGVDLAAAYGTGIGASDAGTVVHTGWVPVGGLSVQIRHASGLVTGYYHMGTVFVAAGQTVDRGQIVGTVGLTGVTTGPHVHWEATLNGAYVNPLAY